MKGGSRNELVEENRGVKHRDTKIEHIIKELEVNNVDREDLHKYENWIATMDNEEQISFSKV